MQGTNKQKKNYSSKHFVNKVVDTEVSLSTFQLSALWCSLQILIIAKVQEHRALPVWLFGLALF